MEEMYILHELQETTFTEETHSLELFSMPVEMEECQDIFEAVHEVEECQDIFETVPNAEECQDILEPVSDVEECQDSFEPAPEAWSEPWESAEEPIVTPITPEAPDLTICPDWEMELAQAYVRAQPLEDIYAPEEGLMMGTAFPNLFMPYHGRP